LQLVSKGGLGNTTVGRVIGTVWGGDRNPARKIGCGVSWNNTGINLEVLGGAFDQMFLYLDDMHNAGEAEIKAILNTMNGEGRGRSTDDQRAEFSTPVLSSANTSVVNIARRIKSPHLIIPLIDRLMEFGLPAGCPYFFEDIRTKAEFRVYGNQLRKLARENFGWAGPQFVRRLASWMKRDRNAVQAFVDERHEAYHDAAANIESLGDRDLGRVSNKFATLYASACFAVRFKILPFTEAEVLEALLTCHRDNVAFIDEQLGATPAKALSAAIAPAAAVAVAQQPFARLKRFIDDKNRKGGFLDLRKLGAKVPKGVAPKGYVSLYGGHKEYWLTGADFETTAGSKTEAHDLKVELAVKGLIATERRGKSGISYVVKRLVPGVGRNYVVAIRADKPKGGARASAAP
jgi:hypothetical protein